MTSVLIGEFVGTFSLLLIGIGGCVFFNLSKKVKNNYFLIIGLIWGIAILIANIIGLVFGSNKLNPVFSLLDLYFKELEIIQFVCEVLGQFLGAYTAMIVIRKLIIKWIEPNKQIYKLSLYAPFQPTGITLCQLLAEIIGTGFMVSVATFFTYIKMNKFYAAIGISCVMAILIMRIAPITGASFNPVRDFVPRLYYKLHVKLENQERPWRKVWLTSLAPFLGAFLGYGIRSIILR